MSKLRRLRANALPQQKPRVDRTGSGRINGLSIATKGEALGHGFDLDDVSLDQVAETVGGAKGRWTHGNLCADGLGKHLGRVDPASVKREGDHVLGDFVFSKRAHEFQPEGLTVSAADYLMSQAEDEPDTLGLSIVFKGETVESEGTVTGLAARIDSTPRVDFVADPAANPAGLFAGTGSELSAETTEQLDEIVEAIGLERVTSFARSYLMSKGQTLAEPEAQAEPVELSEVTAELAALKAKHEAALAELANFRKAEADRVAAEREGYLESIRVQTAALQSPVDAADLSEVEELFELGKDDLARKLGERLVRIAELSSKAGEFERGEQLAERTGPTSAEVTAKHLRKAGWTVELSADRTEILKSTPRGQKEA